MRQVFFAIAVFIVVSTTGRCVNFTVNNNSDAGAGSLRQAIIDASLAGGGTITFSGVSGTIALQSSLPLLVTNTIILGPGVNELTVSAASAPVLTNALGSTAYIRGLRLTSIGGVVYNLGRLTLNECVVSDGNNPEGPGAGIYNAGSMHLQNCAVANNRGGPGCKGAGIYNSGDLSMDDCTVSGNRTYSDAGGGIYNTGTMDLNRCLISTNSATFGAGFGIYNSGTARLNTCTVAGNFYTGAGSGGGLFNSSGTMVLRNCSVTNNTSTRGGGIWNSGWVEAFGCVFSGNRADYSSGPTPGGAIYNDPKGTVLIENTTISRNSSLDLGGGIMNHGTLVAMNSTIASNFAVRSGGSAQAGGGIWNAGTVHSKNSIFAGNSAAQGPDFYGTLYSDGFNLIQDTKDCAIVGVRTGNLTDVHPSLGALQDNGGPTWTHALLSGSPAIENGSNYGAPSTDQRGVPRPQGLNVDIGAFEFQPDQPMFLAITAQSYTNVWMQSWSRPGASHTLEASTNLTQWLRVTDFNADPNGLWEFNDAKLKDRPTRFYRVK
jgi:hypothetical protein